MASTGAPGYTLAELAELLPFSRKMLESLVKSGELRAEDDGETKRFTTDELQAFLQRCLLAIKVEREPSTIELVTPERLEEDEIRVVEREVVAPVEIEESRRAERYFPRLPIDARLGTIDLRIIQLSASGVRVHHVRPMRIGTEGRLALTSPVTGKVRSARGRVTWSRLATASDGEARLNYVSGIEAVESSPFLAETIDELKTREALEAEGNETLNRKAESLRAKMKKREEMRAAPPSAASSEKRMIANAILKLRANPDEAQQWFNRGRFALAQAEVRTIVPAGVREREEALAVWESLGRKVDLRVVSKMVMES